MLKFVLAQLVKYAFVSRDVNEDVWLSQGGSACNYSVIVSVSLIYMCVQVCAC